MTAQTVDWSRGKIIAELIPNAVIATPQKGEAVAAGPTRIQSYVISGAGVSDAYVGRRETEGKIAHNSQDTGLTIDDE